MEDTILTLAAQLGGVDPQAEPQLALCCRLAAAELSRKLKPGVTPEQCDTAFAAAAAKLALSDWLLLGQIGQPRKFTAGEISVELSETEARSLRDQALRQMEGFLVDGGVALRGVKYR